MAELTQSFTLSLFYTSHLSKCLVEYFVSPPMTHSESDCSFSLAVWKGSPSVQRRALAKTAHSARHLTCVARSATLTAAVRPPHPGTLHAWLPPVRPAWPGPCEHATNLQVWPCASKRKRRTRDARPFLTAMNSQQICRIRRY